MQHTQERFDYTYYKKLLMMILAVAFPAIIEMALNTMLMVADTVMVSRMVGRDALSAVGIANSVMYTMIFVFTAFNTGAVAMISRNFGEKKIDRATDIAHVNLTLNIVIGIGVTIIAYALKEVFFYPYDITEAVREQLYLYYDIILMGIVFQFFNFAFASTSRGVSDTKTPMYVTGIANITNIIFNYIFIKGIWFIPAMGVGGAALGTTLSRLIAMGIYMAIFFSGRHTLKYTFKGLHIDREILKPLWRISFPGAIEQFMMQFAFLLAGVVITTLDTDSEALFRILLNLESTSFMPAVGISIAAAALVGKSLGEKDVDKAHAVGQLSGFMSIAWGVVMGIIFFTLPLPLLRIFTSEMDLITLGIPVMAFLAINQPMLNYTIAMSGALRGAGDTKIVMRLTAIRLWSVFLPGTYIAIVHLNAGVAGLWYAEILSFVIFSTILYKRFNSKSWALIEF